MSSVPGTAQAAERPERSRNAKAQARHRAKRKAYIEQLEQTVTKLQTALGFSPEQVAALPPPLVKIRELEQENERLARENDELHRALADAGINPATGTRMGMDSLGRRASPLGTATYGDPHRTSERDFKRRKVEGTMDDYMPPSVHHHHDLARPPPLTIPPSHHYPPPPSSSSSTPASLFLPPPTAPPGAQPFPGTATPSGGSSSTSTSSPPFSPATMHAQHAQAHSPVGHRPPSIPHGMQPQYATTTNGPGGGAYGSVKAEDDNYSSSNHSPHGHSSHSGHGHYSLPPFSQTLPDHGHTLESASWHPTYSSERAPLHR
ncbi:BZIP domain-containing protein [Mycena chlorophos]|uniref:BZIP domain-containing protein n=1 Tax=Mycena chlorophos TaxID=658473 RepID=A0A8H6WLX6_MYCCL|nr:BZIP domain-containing protein [Mycena chlorophos]